MIAATARGDVEAPLPHAVRDAPVTRLWFLLMLWVMKSLPELCVGWGGGKVERFIEKLYRGGKRLYDRPRGSCLTYVNFPTTEFLELPFSTFSVFNVYLEAQDASRPTCAFATLGW